MIHNELPIRVFTGCPGTFLAKTLHWGEDLTRHRDIQLGMHMLV